MTTGTSWANQWAAPPLRAVGASQGGMPLIPKPGGYGQTPQLPYMRSANPSVAPAGAGPVEMGREGMNLSFFLAKPRYSGRAEHGNPWRQGERARVEFAGIQGLDGSVKWIG